MKKEIQTNKAKERLEELYLCEANAKEEKTRIEYKLKTFQMHIWLAEVEYGIREPFKKQ